MNLSKLLSFEQGRITFFETLTKHPENWQQNPTPLCIVRKMLDKTSLEDKKILVLFNIEFLQVLVEERKINPENIYYIADNELEYLSAIKIFKVQSYKLSDFSVPALKKLIAGIDMKFDVVFSNPPYNGNIDIKILNEIIDIADEFVVVHPSTWLIDIKDKSKLYQDFKKLISKKLKSVEMFNGNPVFNIGLLVPVSITHIVQSSKSIDINNFGEKYTSENIFSITKFGQKWDELLLPFKTKIEHFIDNNNGSVWSNRIWQLKQQRVIDETKFYCQIASIRGGEERNKIDVMYKGSFYNMINLDSASNKGIRKLDSGGATLEFSSEVELDNFINYLKTDFARFTLALLKNKSDLHRGELEIVPWLDFTEEWDDDKLFAKFDVSQELQDYIRDFMTDCYGIRK
jgi:hypothetical protein